MISFLSFAMLFVRNVEQGRSKGIIENSGKLWDRNFVFAEVGEVLVGVVFELRGKSPHYPIILPSSVNSYP